MTVGRVGIVGGSMAGLGLAWALRSHGLEATVFERSAGHLEHRGTGVMLAPDIPGLLGLQARPVSRRLWLSPTGRVLHERPVSKLATGWAEVYTALRRLTEGIDLRSGAPVEAVSGEPPRLKVGGQWQDFDLVVGADGLASTVRAALDPEFQPGYLGYVAVRGLLPRAKLPAGLPPALESVFEDAMIQVLMAGEHVTLYGLPGERLNWMWYRNTEPSELGELLTDGQGVRHHWSLPPQAMHPRVDLLLRNEAALRPGLLSELVNATETLFLQPVFGGSARRCLAPGLALCGDAAHLAVPHAGAGVTLALHDSLGLAAALAQGRDLREWEAQRRREAVTHLDLATRIGRALQSPGPDWENWTGEQFENWWAALIGSDQPYFERTS